MTEVEPLAPPIQTYHVKHEDGTIYAAANDLAQAVMLAGALATAAGTAHSPSIRVVNKDTLVVEAIIGRPSTGEWLSVEPAGREEEA